MEVLTEATGSMSDVITGLTTGVNASTIFGVVKDIMPFIATMVPIALGLYLLRRLVSGAGRARVKF